MKSRHITMTLIGGVGLAFLLLLTLCKTQPGSRAADLTVCPAGPPTCDYSSIQAAVDAASSGDVIRIAAGTYADLHARAGITQVVYIDKNVTLRGGYDTSFTEPPNPGANHTELYAQYQGRGIYIQGDVQVVLDGLEIVGGDATGLGGALSGDDAGGGVYISQASVTLNRCLLNSNRVQSAGNAYGGGLYAQLSPGLVISETVVTNNTVQCGASNFAQGGGIYAGYNTKTTIYKSNIGYNTSDGADARGGGLAAQDVGELIVAENTLFNNHADTYGGGIYINGCEQVFLDQNTVADNTVQDGGGGGFVFWDSTVTAQGNTVSDNKAYNSSSGGGGWVYDPTVPPDDLITLIGNVFSGNYAHQDGAGLFALSAYLKWQDTVLRDNLASRNGGGLCFWMCQADMVNTAIVINGASSSGSGAYMVSTPLQMWHSTIAYNGSGDQSGLVITGTLSPYSSIVLTNSIIARQNGTGIAVNTGSTVTLNGVLWYNNGQNSSGNASISHDVTGNPNFQADRYHVTYNSPARNAGVGSSIPTDIDGQLRDRQPDLGVDEFNPLSISKHGEPDPVCAGAPLTYTIRVTNTSGLILYTTITDTFPAQVTPGGVQTRSANIGSNWQFPVVVTPAADYVGPLVNRIQATTQEGGWAVYTDTAEVRMPARGLALSGPTGGHTGVAYALTAAVSPANATLPVTYTWQADDHAATQHGGSLSATRVFSWLTTGPKTVVVTVTNWCGAAVTATHTITIEPCVELSGLALSGPPSATLDVGSAFTAAVSPSSAVLPVTYTWQVNDQSTVIRSKHGLQDALSLSWSTVGTKTITVSATNVCGTAVSGTHYIYIYDDRWYVYLPIVLKNRMP